MSNEAKSRIMLWLFIMLLCTFAFLMGRRARADVQYHAGVSNRCKVPPNPPSNASTDRLSLSGAK